MIWKWTDGRMDEWMDGWMFDGCMLYTIQAGPL